MNNAYKLVVFDWEGTLSDPYGAILKALEDSAHNLGYASFDKSLAYQKIGLSLPIIVKQLFPDLTSHEQEIMLQFVQHKIVQHTHDVYLNIGAMDTVKWLSENNIYTAIATNKSQVSLQRVINASGLQPYISVTRSASQCQAKPAPDMLEEIMLECDISHSQTLMIGDSSSDIEMALACNVPVIGLDITYQLKSELEAAGATVVLHSYKELNTYLNLV